MTYSDYFPIVPDTLKGLLDCEDPDNLFDTAAVADDLRERGIDRGAYLAMDREERDERFASIWEAHLLTSGDVA